MRKKPMLKGYDDFVNRMTEGYAQARACLERGDYVGAQRILAQMGISHARTSLSLRNVLIKDGLMKEDK
jgi:hypothetical protein